MYRVPNDQAWIDKQQASQKKSLLNPYWLRIRAKGSVQEVKLAATP